MTSDMPRVVRLQTPLGRVRGLGSARNGTKAWIAQRVSSIALLPLTIWFAISAVSLVGASREQAVAWIGSLWNAVLLLTLIGLTFQHMMAGLQEVAEDYIRPESLKLAVVMVIRAACWLLGLAAALAVLKIAI